MSFSDAERLGMEDEVRQRMRDFPVKLQAMEKKIVVAARAAIPVLKDASREHSAGELEVLFFELDAINQEFTDFVSRNRNAVLRAITDQLLTDRQGRK